MKLKVDCKTISLFFLQICGSTLICIAYYAEILPILYAVLLGTFFMNLSFTPWHEASHKNLSKNVFLNTCIAVISSIFSLYPAYFHKKREHLIHHKFSGDEKLDPVFPRIQTNLFYFLPNLLFRIILRKEKLLYDGMKLSKKERILDYLHYVIVLLTLALSLYFQFFDVLLYSLIIPRILVFALHAIYICYFPHSNKNGGFIVSKKPSYNLFLFYLTLGQSAHGVHHENPNIPWHQLLLAPNETEKKI